METIILQKVVFSKSENYEELFFFTAYAYNSKQIEFKIQGLSTPELNQVNSYTYYFTTYIFNQNLIHQLKSGKPFSCNLIKQESGAYKLVKWKNPNFEDLRDPVRSYSFGDIEVFQPTLISLRRINKSLSSTIKSSCGSVRFGFVSQDWVFLVSYPNARKQYCSSYR